MFDHPALHTKLFAKLPFVPEGATKSERLSSSVSKQPAQLYEINAYRLMEAAFPVKTPKFYFGDFDDEASSLCIITVRFPLTTSLQQLREAH